MRGIIRTPIDNMTPMCCSLANGQRGNVKSIPHYTGDTRMPCRCVLEPDAPIEFIHDGWDGALAVVIRAACKQQGFFTPRDIALQVGVLHHPAGHAIPAHIHTKVQRIIGDIPEVLLVRSGHVRAHIYNSKRELIKFVELQAEDVIVLLRGGHGFEVLEDAVIYEVRQGPYLGDEDKTRFPTSYAPGN